MHYILQNVMEEIELNKYICSIAKAYVILKIRKNIEEMQEYINAEGINLIVKSNIY